MEIMILGLLLWSLVHLTPSLAPSVKQRCLGALGENGYKSLFSILLIIALCLIVYGWRHSSPSYLYAAAAIATPVSWLLMAIAMVLFIAARTPSRIKQFIRHPQLTSVVLWAISHLLVNGDSRSMVLFAGLGGWAIIEMLAINRRDGPWSKPPVPGWSVELIVLCIGLALFAIVAVVHPYIAGVAIL